MVERIKVNLNFDVYFRDMDMFERWYFFWNDCIVFLWIVFKIGWVFVKMEEMNLKEV